jgi:hypothetical protein
MKHLARTFLNDDNYWREDTWTYDDIHEKRLLEGYLKDKSNPFHIERLAQLISHDLPTQGKGEVPIRRCFHLPAST